QLGAPLLDMITPTNGALFAMLGGAGVSFGRWLRFAVPGMLLVSAVGLVGLILLR
ncbi:MAG: YfcC family protein, partial [Gemmatimonadales bacterium]